MISYQWTAAVTCDGFAAGRPAGRRYRSIAARHDAAGAGRPVALTAPRHSAANASSVTFAAAAGG